MSSPVVVMLLRPCPHVSGYFWKLKKIHIHTKCIQIIFAYPHEKAVKNNGNMIDDVFMVYDSHHCIRKPLFSSVHLQTKGWCFQRFQPWRAFLKRCVFVIMYEWTVDQTEEKVPVYKKRDLLMTKSICSGKYVYLLNVLITNALCILHNYTV